MAEPNSNLSPGELDRLIQLASAYREDRISDAEVAELDTMLSESPAAQETFVEIGMLVAELSQTPNVGSTNNEQVARRTMVFPKNSWIRPVGLATLAASLLVIIGYWAWSSKTQDRLFAQLASESNCLWKEAATAIKEGQRIGIGHFRLASGIATIQFDNGAQVELEGSSDLEILGKERCYLHSGKLVVTVENDFKGFTVDTPYGRLIDQGTSFGVTVEDNGASVVEVFDGRVDVKHHDSGELRQLDEEGFVRLLAKEIVDESEYEPPETPAIADVLQVSTASPGSADCAVRRDDKKRVKMKRLPLSARKSPVANSKFDTRICLRFDLKGLPAKKIEDASLQLNVIPSGMGYASKSIDTTYVAYGVAIDTLDDWTSGEVSWKHLAGAIDDPANAEDIHLLGRFTVLAGQQSGQCFVEGSELSKLISRDENQLVSIVIMSETVIRKGTLRIAFADSSHPSLKAPTLRLKFEE